MTSKAEGFLDRSGEGVGGGEGSTNRRCRRAQAEQLIPFVVLDFHRRLVEDWVLRLRAGQGDDVQVFTHQVHRSRGFHGSPCDVLEKVKAYLGGLSSSLKDALKLFLLAD